MTTKPHHSFDEQLDKLISRDLIVKDRNQALHYLSHINYYRLRGYWIPFEVDLPVNGDEHQFIKGTTFESILNLYVFDRGLRTLCMDAIERIEISIRTQWAYHVAKEHGTCAYLNSHHYYNKNNPHSVVLDRTKNEFMRSKELYALHYRNKSPNPEHPDYNTIPTWVFCESMSLGSLSKWYGGIKYRQTRQNIAKTYNLDERSLVSFLHHLAVFRNTCAHHLRLWNKKFTFEFKRQTQLADNFNHYEQNHDLNHLNRKVYNTLTMLTYMLSSIAPENSFKIKLKSLLHKHNIDVVHMGFPEYWEKLEIWL